MPRRRQDRVRGSEHRNDPERAALGHFALTLSIISRTSDIETIGRKRSNRKNSVIKRPIDPASVIQSQSVGWNSNHHDGMRLWFRLDSVKTMRSIHMPTIIPPEISNSKIRLRRTNGNQSNCGMIEFSAFSVQNNGAMEPNMRSENSIRSATSWL